MDLKYTVAKTTAEVYTETIFFFFLQEPLQIHVACACKMCNRLLSSPFSSFLIWIQDPCLIIKYPGTSLLICRDPSCHCDTSMCCYCFFCYKVQVSKTCTPSREKWDFSLDFNKAQVPISTLHHGIKYQQEYIK